MGYLKAALKIKNIKDKLFGNEKDGKKSNSFDLFKSPIVIKSLIFGGGGFTFFLLGFIFLCIVAFGAVFLAEEYFSNGITASAYDYCGESCGENESNFYSKLNDVKESYKSKGVDIDANLITGTIFYGSSINGESFDPNDPDSDDLVDDSKIHISDIKSLASHMVNGNQLDYGKYREYLIETYIPKRFGDMFSDDKGKERIADEIMSYASYSSSDIASSGQSYLSILCPQICTKDGDCWSLDEYVSRVVSAESGSISGFTDNYVEQWKAQSVAARTFALRRTNFCKNPIENSQNAQVADRSNNIRQEIIDAVNETSGMVLTYEGELTDAMYDSFYKGSGYHCDDEFCYATYKKVGGGSIPQTHEIKAYKRWSSSFAGGHGSGMSQFGAAYLADTGKDYKEILSYFYDDDVEISFMGGNIGVGEITGGILFPLGVNTKTGNCVSAGNYYMGGKYHGAVDIAGVSMGYSNPPTEIPVISATPGKVVSVAKDSWCSDTNYTNADSRLPRISGCQGNYVVIINDDPSSEYNGYKFIYYHLDSVASDIELNGHVQAGQPLGYMGSTGNSTGYHLHFGIKNPSGGDLNNTPVPDYVTDLIRNYCSNNKEGS